MSGAVYRLLLPLLCLFVLAGCASAPSPLQRLSNAEQLASSYGWKQETINSEPFDIVAFLPKKVIQNPLLTIYFEGDGLAWVNRTTPSSDPTPVRPIGLLLALKHQTDNVAYLARPCQFTKIESLIGCDSAYWTSKRFSEEVIKASGIAIDKLKHKFGAAELQFIGYSGGGAVAALLAARRADVARLVTVAGNLDHKLWASKHRISPLIGSLNPPDYWHQLKDIPQIHFIGQYDEVIMPEVAASYSSRFLKSIKPKVITVPKFGHACCWVEQWPSLLPSL